MSDAEKSQQVGQLVLDKQAAQKAHAELVLKAKNLGNHLSSLGSLLIGSPASIGFPREAVDTRFQPRHLADGTVPTADELKLLVNAIRLEQIKIWDAESALKTLGL